MISCCCSASDLVVFEVNVALKTDLSKNFQETKTEKSSQDVLSLKMCWECRVLILLRLLNLSMSRWKIRLVVGLSALIWRGGEGLSWFIVSIQVKKLNKKPFYFFLNDTCIFNEHSEAWEHYFCYPNSLLILSAKLWDPKNTIQISSFLSDKSVPEPEFK